MRTVRLIGFLIYGLGIIILVLGAAMPAYFSGLAVRQSPTTITPPSQPQLECSVSTTTITDVNGTHRLFAVTCTQPINISAGLTVVFTPGPESLTAALSSVFTVLSIVSAVGITMIAIVFQGKALDKTKVLAPSFLALCAFSTAIALTVVFGLSGPLSGSPPPEWSVYSLIVSTFWGYGLSILALAGIVMDRDSKT